MRDFNYDIMDEIKNRWSPRSFKGDPVEEDYLLQMIDAARFAPSCFNEQPFRYVIFASSEEVKLAKDHLLEGNKEWNQTVPAYIGILYNKSFSRNGKENKWAAFDTGTSWGFLALEAVHLGLVTHAMAGFKRKLLREALGIPEDFEFIALVAVGYLDDSDEKPNTRHPLNSFILNRD